MHLDPMARSLIASRHSRDCEPRKGCNPLPFRAVPAGGGKQRRRESVRLSFRRISPPILETPRIEGACDLECILDDPTFSLA